MVCTLTCTCMHTCMYTHTHTHTHSHTNRQIHMHAHIHTHTYTYLQQATTRENHVFYLTVIIQFQESTVICRCDSKTLYSKTQTAYYLTEQLENHIKPPD